MASGVLNPINKTNQPNNPKISSKFFFFYVLLAFFKLEAAFSPQGSLWMRPDVPGTALPHSLLSCNIHGQAGRHLVIYLFISSSCTTAGHAQSILFPLPLSHSPFYFSFPHFVGLPTSASQRLLLSINPPTWLLKDCNSLLLIHLRYDIFCS